MFHQHLNATTDEPISNPWTLALWFILVKASLNMRINLLYFLDSLCEASAQSLSNEKTKAASSSSTANPGLFYVHLIEKDLDTIVQHAVPESRDGLMNVQSTMQVSWCVVSLPKCWIMWKMLENWRIKRILDPKVVEHAISSLDRRKETCVCVYFSGRTHPMDCWHSMMLTTLSIQALALQQHAAGIKVSHGHTSRNEVVKRIEEDRERVREIPWSLNPTIPLAIDR